MRGHNHLSIDPPRNQFKHGISDGQLQIGLWSTLASNIAAEVVAESGFDWIMFDTEHSPNEIPGLVSQLQAVRCGNPSPVVRPAWNDAVLFKRILDIACSSGFSISASKPSGGFKRWSRRVR